MSKNSKRGLKDLDTLSQETPSNEPTVAAGPSSSYLSPLSRSYLNAAIVSLNRFPSPKLKPEFRATLMHWKGLMAMSLKAFPDDEPQAFISVVLATIESDGSWDAMRMIRNVAQQVLWQASVDVQRDRRTASEVEEERSNFTDGMDTHVDSEYVPPPTESEAIDAYVLAHSWLSMLADLLPNDDEDRARLSLDGGLAFCDVQLDFDRWDRVYDAERAIELQIAKNTKALQRRDAAKVLTRKASFNALAALLKEQKAA